MLDVSCKILEEALQNPLPGDHWLDIHHHYHILVVEVTARLVRTIEGKHTPILSEAHFLNGCIINQFTRDQFNARMRRSRSMDIGWRPTAEELKEKPGWMQLSTRGNDFTPWYQRVIKANRPFYEYGKTW